MFRSRDFTVATIALFLFFVGFAILLLISVLFLQDFWHYSAVRDRPGHRPGTGRSAVFAAQQRPDRQPGSAALSPATVGCVFMALSATYFLLAAPHIPPTSRASCPAC